MVWYGVAVLQEYVRMARGDQVYRQWGVLRAMMRGRVSRRELAERFGVSLKTIARDVELLSAFPIVEEREGIDVLYSCISVPRVPAVEFSAEEIAAVAIGREHVVRSLHHSALREALESALVKIERMQCGGAQGAVVDLAHVVHVDFAGVARSSPHWDDLVEAARLRRRVRMTYFTAARQSAGERVVEPLCIHVHARGVHVIAYCLQRRDFINFNMYLIQSLELLKEPFGEESAHFDREAYLASGFDGYYDGPVMDVCLNVHPPASYWVKDRVFHPTQVIQECSNGSVEITFQSRGAESIALRVLGLGASCEVVRPDVLRDMVHAQARAVLGL